MLPPDDHVHSEWSWDAVAGSMDQTCRRALELGLPSVAFTEHADHTPWTLKSGQKVPEGWRSLVAEGVLTPPSLDLAGYWACLEACRERHPGLRILSGVELSEPHWHTSRAESLLGAGRFERVLASVHSAVIGHAAGFTEVSARYEDQRPEQVVRDYLHETVRLIEQLDQFEVLAHIDYPVRRWPADAKPYDPQVFEEEYRQVLSRLAAADKVLEVNTRVPVQPVLLTWWRQEGGRAISFASDAHTPDAVADGFGTAVQLAEAAGFRPGRDPYEFWRSG